MIEGPDRSEPPEASRRSDAGYRAAARIEQRAGRQSRLIAAILGLVVVFWAGVTVGQRLFAGTRTGDRTPSGQSTDVANGPVPPAVPQPTYPPDIEVLQPRAGIPHVPVVLGGLAWFDLRTGALDRSLSLELGQWRFALADGAACVCLEAARGLSAAMLHVYRWDRAGVLTSADSLGAWLPKDQTITLLDAVLTPDARSAIVGSVVQDGDRWSLRIQGIPLDGDGPVVEATQPGIDLTSLGDPARLQLRLFLSPDGHRLRLTLQQLADDLAAIEGTERSWSTTLDAQGFGPFHPGPDVPGGAPAGECPEQAWADPTTFAELCRSPDLDGHGRQPLFVRLLKASGDVKDVAIGSVFQQDTVGWQVDGSVGVIYAWSAMDHKISRITAASGSVVDRSFTQPGVQQDAAALQAIAPDGPTPARRLESAIWQPLIPANQTNATPLVGSADGSLLYATGYGIGFDAAGSGNNSTGIWVFDAASLALVAHWPAVAGYEVLGLAPGGRYVMALGTPSGSEIATFGNHGPQLVLHDSIDGSVLAIQRELILRLGGMPYLLAPGPPG